jgi:superfamily II DNA or RNA helicase
MGKTRTFVLLPKEGARTLVIVPRRELILQTVRQIRGLRNCEADIEQADLWAIPETEFVVASWDTLVSNDRYKRFLGKVDLVVVDEAHINFTVLCRDVLNQFVDAGARVLGCTATAYRSDKKNLLGFYDKLSWCLPLREAIRDGWLVGPRVTVHQVKSIDLKGLAKKAREDFDPRELDAILSSEAALHDIVGLVKEQHVPGKQGIIFAHSVRHATRLREIMVDRHGMDVSLVHSYQSDEEYEQEIGCFKSGARDLIVNVDILSAGFDHPPVAEVYMAKPTKSLAKYVQRIGRATRTLDKVLDGLETREERLAAIAASDKPFFRVFDLTDTTRCHQIMSAVEVLAGQPRKIVDKVKEELPEDATIEDIDAAVEAELKAEAEAARLQREEERRRKQSLVVGVTFGSEDRDPFALADRKTAHRREFRFPFGKWKGQPLSSPLVKTSYLEWAVREARLTPMWKQAFTNEINRRHAAEKSAAQKAQAHAEATGTPVPVRGKPGKSNGFKREFEKQRHALWKSAH